MPSFNLLESYCRRCRIVKPGIVNNRCDECVKIVEKKKQERQREAQKVSDFADNIWDDAYW